MNLSSDNNVLPCYQGDCAGGSGGVIFINELGYNVGGLITGIGLDWVDKVTVKIKVYNAYGLQYNMNHTRTVIKQFLPRNMEKDTHGRTKIVVSNIVGTDEGDVGTLPDATLTR